MELKKKFLGLATLAFVASLSVGIAVTTASANEPVETAKFEMVGGAQVRTADPAGIRFVTDVNNLYKQQLQTQYPTDTYTYVWGTTVSFTASGDTEETVMDAKTDKWLNDGTRWYTALVNIPATDYLTEITAESYVKIYNGEELVETKTVSNAQTRSIAYSASWALNDGYEDAILKTYTAAISDASVTLDKEGVSYVSTGNEVQLSATVSPSQYGVAWSTSDKNVATVDKNGKVTAVGAGLATITASLGNKSDSYQVAVDYTSFNYEDGKVSPIVVGGLKPESMLNSAENPGELPLSIAEINTDGTANKAYGTDGLDNVANAAVYIDIDWLNFVFSNSKVNAITFDVYTSGQFGWIKTNDHGTVRLNENQKVLETLGDVRKVRITWTREQFETINATADVKVTFRIAGGLEFFYLDNFTTVEDYTLETVDYEDGKVSPIVVGGLKPESMLNSAENPGELPLSIAEINTDGTANKAYGTDGLDNVANAGVYIDIDWLKFAFDNENVTAVTFDIYTSANPAWIKTNDHSTIRLDKEVVASGNSINKIKVTWTREKFEALNPTTDVKVSFRVSGGMKLFYLDNFTVVTAE